MELGDKFRLVLATTLREDGFPDTGEWNPLEQGSYFVTGSVYVLQKCIFNFRNETFLLKYIKTICQNFIFAKRAEK